MGEGFYARTQRHHGMGAGIVAVASFAALTSAAWTAEQRASHSAAQGVVSGVFVAGAVIAATCGWRRLGRARWGLASAVGAMLAAQAVLVGLPAIALPPPRSAPVLVTLGALGLVGMALVLVALYEVWHERHLADDSFAIGIGMGQLAAAHLSLLVPVAVPVRPVAVGMVCLVAATHLAVVAIVVVVVAVPRRTSALLTVTAVLVCVVLVLRLVPASDADGLVLVGLAAAGAAWIGAAWSAVQRASERSSQRTREEIHHTVEASTRDMRERMHELRSTVAGLVNGSEMLDNPAVPVDVRSHLLGSVRSELERMQRLLSTQEEAATTVDVADALSPMLDMQRSKGRRVEMQGCGGLVEGRQDALAEVINILLDNAATHGGCDTSRVDVAPGKDGTVDISVTDDGTGVPPELRERIFDWGDRRDDSPGEGIGLNLAQRLVARDGGTLQLVDAPAEAGSRFVISLPAPRQSVENAISEGDTHVAQRRQG